MGPWGVKVNCGAGLIFCWDPVVWSPRRLDVVKCQLEETECFFSPSQKYNSSVPEKLTLDPMGNVKGVFLSHHFSGGEKS